MAYLFSFQMMYKSQFIKTDTYVWFCGPRSQIVFKWSRNPECHNGLDSQVETWHQAREIQSIAMTKEHNRREVQSKREQKKYREREGEREKHSQRASLDRGTAGTSCYLPATVWKSTLCITDQHAVRKPKIWGNTTTKAKFVPLTERFDYFSNFHEYKS